METPDPKDARIIELLGKLDAAEKRVAQQTEIIETHCMAPMIFGQCSAVADVVSRLSTCLNKWRETLEALHDEQCTNVYDKCLSYGGSKTCYCPRPEELK